MSVVKFSLREQGGYKLSPYFRVSEFACKDGSDAVFIDLALVVVLDAIREHFQAPVTIMSGYRTEEYNEKIGGAAKSQHVLGKAADIRVRGVSPSAVYRWLDTWHEGGLGRYDTFTHVDTRTNKARWQG